MGKGKRMAKGKGMGNWIVGSEKENGKRKEKGKRRRGIKRVKWKVKRTEQKKTGRESGKEEGKGKGYIGWKRQRRGVGKGIE